MSSTRARRRATRAALVAILAGASWAAACAPEVVSAPNQDQTSGSETADPITDLDRRADVEPDDDAPTSAAPAPGCLTLDTVQVEFGQQPVGTTATATVSLINCGDETLTVHEVRLASTSVPFALDCSLLAEAKCPSAEAPLELPAEGVAKIRVRFEPTTTTDAMAYDLESTHLVIESSAATPEVLVSLSGAAVGADCPIATIEVEEGDRVTPVTRLHVSGEGSYSPHGKITQYWWTVKSPDGPPTLVLPDPTSGSVTLDADLAGTYLIRLGVWDAEGNASCMDATYYVDARPETGIHVELTWETPGDEDELDSGKGQGSDLDLHLLHPLADGPDQDGDGLNDGWFDVPWDCFWFNPSPGWGPESGAYDDDPVLLRDDLDGGGPEVVSVPEPQDGAVYRIGVHHWNDHGYGESSAQLRVWIEGELVQDIDDITLLHGDLWKAAHIHWPSGEVEIQKDGGALKLSSDYAVPDSFEYEED